MFFSRNKKNNVYPCKPQFYYIKMGFKGSKLYRHDVWFYKCACAVPYLGYRHAFLPEAPQGFYYMSADNKGSCKTTLMPLLVAGVISTLLSCADSNLEASDIGGGIIKFRFLS